MPHLIEAIDRFDGTVGGDPFVLLSVVEALVRATGVSLAGDGSVASRLPNADATTHQVTYETLPQVAAQWKKWWESHKNEY